MLSSLPTTQVAMKWMLSLQLFLAVGLIVLSTFSTISLPDLSPRKVEDYNPVSPGDQRRPYEVRQFKVQTDREHPNLRLSSPADLPEQLTFSVLEDSELGSILLLEGDVSENASRRFVAFLNDLTSQPDYVLLHSPGGLVLEALQIGSEIRKRGLKTLLVSNSICISSCPYVFSGGTERRVFEGAIIGLHQHYYDQPRLMPVVFAVESIQAGQAKTMEYLQEMGINLAVSILAMKTSPDNLYVLLPEEMERYGVATSFIRKKEP